MKFFIPGMLLATLTVGLAAGYLAGYAEGKCAGINWLAKEHNIAAQCK